MKVMTCDILVLLNALSTTFFLINCSLIIKYIIYYLDLFDEGKFVQFSRFESGTRPYLTKQTYPVLHDLVKPDEMMVRKMLLVEEEDVEPFGRKGKQIA